MKIRDIETPAILLDRKIMEENSRKMEAIIRGTSMVLYPHYKSHKCLPIAQWQMAHGAGGITCAKLGEAEDLAEGGIPRVVIANQIVQAEKIRRLAKLAGKTDLTVCADDGENILALESACAAENTQLSVLIELEVGMNRCGVEDFEDFYELARLTADQPHLTFLGIQAYAGQLSHESHAAKRREILLQIEKRVAELKTFLEKRGLQVREICGGSTGTAADKPKGTVYTQLQAGSYLFMDTSYERLNLVFEHAMRLATTVISVKADRIVTDCGVKSFSMDQFPPRYVDYPEAELSFSEEHTTILTSDPAVHIGDSLYCLPGHCCTTNNCFGKIYLTEGDEVLAEWPVTSRGKAQ